MKEQIEQALQVLLGQPMWEAGRVVDLEWFQFGEQHTVRSRSDEVKVVGTYALHVQCAWRVSGPGGIVVGSRDRYYPAGDPFQESPDFQWDQIGANRCDERISMLFEEHKDAPLTVEAIRADIIGSLHIFLSEGYVLDVFPDDSLDSEHWRFFQPHTKGEHFVVTGIGVET